MPGAEYRPCSLAYPLSGPPPGAGIPMEKLVPWLSTRPAQLAGLSHRKRQAPVGYDADLVVWDPDASFCTAARGPALST